MVVCVWMCLYEWLCACHRVRVVCLSSNLSPSLSLSLPSFIQSEASADALGSILGASANGDPGSPSDDEDQLHPAPRHRGPSPTGSEGSLLAEVLRNGEELGEMDEEVWREGGGEEEVLQ